MPKHDHPGRSMCVALLALAGLTAGCLQSTARPTNDGVRIGVLLPYSGELASEGQNIERAIIMANERLAAAPSSAGQPPFRLVFRDTHSDDVAGYKAAEELITRDAVKVILGPEEPSLAEAMAPLLRDKAVAITGGAVSLESSTGLNHWFRIVPTARGMSSTLAAKLATDSMRSLAIIFTPDPFGNAFANLAAEAFKASGGVVTVMAPLGSDVAHGDLVRSVLATKPNAILLATYPREGAAIVQEWAVIGIDERWYFAPSLRSEAFAVNLPPGRLDGMVGVSAGLPADARTFADEFAARWGGEMPAPNAYYYYDAMMLAGMAYRSAALKNPDPQPADVAGAIVAISGPGGDIVTWQETEDALSLLGQGRDIDYRGASGSIDFSPDGSVPKGFVQLWTINNNSIQLLGRGQ